MKFQVTDELVCPKCGANESHPDGDKIQIRGHKVFDKGSWWSHCLVCSGYYNRVDGEFEQSRGDPNKGWFRS